MQREDGKQIIVLNDRPQPLGAWLAVQRKRLNLTLGDLANAARIRRAYLEAIETGDYKALPGRAYAFAFVRTYAQYVGLDPDEATDRLRAEMSVVPSVREITISSRPSIDPGTVRVAVMGVAVLVPLVGLGFWLMSGTAGDDRVAGPIPTPPTTMVEAPPIPGRAPRIEPPPAAAFAPVPNAGPGAALATPFSAGTNPVPTASAPAPVAAPVAPPVVETPNAPPVVTQRPSPPQDQTAALRLPAPRIAIRATATTFIDIRDAAGNTLVARNLRQGERYFVPNLPGLVLISARLNGLEIQVDNWILPPQGGRTGRREVPLDPDRLLQIHGVPLNQRGQLR